MVGIAVVVGSVVGFAAPGGAAERSDQLTGQTPSVTNLPRLQQVWNLAALGRFEGASAGRTYYTVSNDGKFVHAVDVSKGLSAWHTALAQPVEDFVRIRVHGDAVVLGYAQARSTDAVLAALSATDGRLVWSRTLRCENPDFRTSGKRLFLVCRHEPLTPPSEYRELDPATGRTTANIRIDATAKFGPNGDVCGSSGGSTWCGRLLSDRVKPVWTQPAARWGRLTLTAHHVIEQGNGELTVRRLEDGHLAWKKQGSFQIGVQARTGRLILVSPDDVEVTQLSDGQALARFPMAGRGGANILAEGDSIVVERAGAGAEVILVIDPKLQARVVAKNVPFVSSVVGDVLLSQNVGMSGVNRDDAPLEGYSLSRFAAPEADLDPYHRVVAILERYPFPYQAPAALLALRPIPDAMTAVEKIVALETSSLAPSAIAVAGLSGDSRFVGPLRARLEATTEPPTSVAEWSQALDVVDGLAALRSPDAAVALLAFWRRIGGKLLPAWRRAILKDIVASAVWKYGAHQELVGCEDTTFPVEQADPQTASLGTTAPGVAYVVDGGGRWAAICEARQDDDGNGTLRVTVMQHGDTGGDHLRPYLVLGAGNGVEIDDFVTSDPSGRWVVTTKDMCVHLVDTVTGRAVALRGADGRPGDDTSGDHRAAAFAPDGRTLLYIKSDGARATVVRRDLRTGAERTIDPGPGELSRTFFDRSGRLVVMEVVVGDTDRDGLLTQPRLATTLGSRRCRAPIASASFFGEIGDKPVQRIAGVDGVVRDAPSGSPLAPIDRPRPAYDLASQGPSASGRGDSLPIGPFHWEVSRPPERP